MNISEVKVDPGMIAGLGVSAQGADGDKGEKVQKELTPVLSGVPLKVSEAVGGVDVLIEKLGVEVRERKESVARQQLADALAAVIGNAQLLEQVKGKLSDEIKRLKDELPEAAKALEKALADLAKAKNDPLVNALMIETKKLEATVDRLKKSIEEVKAEIERKRSLSADSLQASEDADLERKLAELEAQLGAAQTALGVKKAALSQAVIAQQLNIAKCLGVVSECKDRVDKLTQGIDTASNLLAALEARDVTAALKALVGEPIPDGEDAATAKKKAEAQALASELFARILGGDGELSLGDLIKSRIKTMV